MGCSVREKHSKTNRRGSSIKPSSSSDIDHCNYLNDKSVFDSEFKPWNCNVGFDEFISASILDEAKVYFTTPKPNYPANSGDVSKMGFDNRGLGYCTEEQLVQILLKHLEVLYNEVISKLVVMGYDKEIALKAVLRNGHCYGPMDVLSNIMHNSVAYLKHGRCLNEENPEATDLVFTELKQLEEYSLAGMIYLLQQIRPELSRGDAMWCLLMSDLHVGRASFIDLPMILSPSDGPDNGLSSMESVSGSVGESGSAVPPGLYKFHGGWGYGNASNLENPVNEVGDFFSGAEASIQRENDFVKRFNLSPSMKSLLKRNAEAFAAGFRSNQKPQQPLMQSQPCSSTTTNEDSLNASSLAANLPDEAFEVSHGDNEEVNSMLSKLCDLTIDEHLECITEDHKDVIVRNLLHQVKDLENQVKERKDWALQKAMQAARKLSSDLTELNILRVEREETQKLKTGKQTLEDTTMKRLSEMENALRKASGQVDRANAAVRKLESENAETRAETEAAKLSASESVKTSSEIVKRENKCLKRLAAWEKKKTKLQEEIAAERQKISSVQQKLVQIHSAQKEAEAKWRQTVKDKELAMAQVEEEKRLKEIAEGNSKRRLEALRLRTEIDSQRHKDDIKRLEQEISRLKSTSQSTEPNHPSDVSTAESPKTAKHQAHSTTHLLNELDEPEREDSERVCIICMKNEVSVVFLPCAHQVMCAGCGEDYGKKGKSTCPCCHAPIEQKIRVFGTSS